MKTFSERLGREILIFDGACGTVLQERGLLPAGARPESLAVDSPDRITELHLDYIRAGADIITTDTFGANSARFPDGAGYSVERIVGAALDCAEEARRASGREGVFIALDVGPSGRLLGSDMDFEEAFGIFSRTVRAGRDRADLIIIETFGSLAETRAALLAAKTESKLPVIVCNVYEAGGRTFSGSGPDVMAAVLSGMGADSVGINCSLGPDEMMKILPRLCGNTRLPVTVMPNAGLPVSGPGGRVTYAVTPGMFAERMARMAEMGATVLGGCCGTTPEHIRRLRSALAGRAPTPRPACRPPFAASETSVRRWEDGFCVIGERINPTGKPRFRESLQRGDIDYCVSEAHAQTAAGAGVIDVNVGIPGIDEAAVLREAVARIQQVSPAPLQIDTADPRAMEAALRIYNGRALINSVNGSEESLSAVLPLAAKYGGTVVGLTLDGTGIPETPEGRLAVARRIVDRAAGYGLTKDDIIIDPLTLTLGSDPQAAEKTLAAVRLIKDELGVRCSLGVSNISFGMPDRDALNRRFLSDAMKAGLDAAIMNPRSEGMMNIARGGSEVPDTAAPAQSAAPAFEDDGTLGCCILGGMKDRAAERAEKLCASRDPSSLITGEVVPALDEAGRLFGDGIMFLPGLLASAEAAIGALGVITAAIEAAGSRMSDSGTVVMATVEGDVHDIGKNIVCVMLRSYGFNVVDLGKNVPPQAVADAVEKTGAAVCGLSALMTTTLPAMKRTLDLLRVRCPGCAVVCGGAVLTQEYCDSIGADFYAPDAAATVAFASRVYGCAGNVPPAGTDDQPDISSKENRMKDIRVPDMRCMHCRARILKGLTEAGIAAEVDLDSKKVTVPDSAAKKAAEVITALGFTAETV